MRDAPPTVRSRHLGRELASALRAADLKAAEVSRLLGWPHTKTSRVLRGKRSASHSDLTAFLAVCGVFPTHRQNLLALAQDAHNPTWWQDHGYRRPDCSQAVVDAENDTATIVSYHPTRIPILLQTTDYARATLLAQPNIPHAEIDDRLTHIKTRQRILDIDWNYARYTAFIEERTLVEAVIGSGNDAVMADQLHHLLTLANRSDIDIRVLPEGNGVGPPTPFSLLEFIAHRPAVCVELLTCTGFLERSESVDAYQRLIAGLKQRALGKTETLDRLTEITKAHTTGSPTQDAPDQHQFTAAT